jgi:hypothetical protein
MPKMFMTKRFPQRKSDFIYEKAPIIHTLKREDLEEVHIEEEVLAVEAKAEDVKEDGYEVEEESDADNEKSGKKAKRNNKKRKNNDMITESQIANAEEQAENLISSPVKVVKKDRGLIERAESSKIILTEDNRQVLND